MQVSLQQNKHVSLVTMMLFHCIFSKDHKSLGWLGVKHQFTYPNSQSILIKTNKSKTFHSETQLLKTVVKILDIDMDKIYSLESQKRIKQALKLLKNDH